MTMLVAVLSGFALSITAPWVHRIGRGATGWLIALLPLTLTLFFSSFSGAIAQGETIRTTYTWVPSLGINIAFVLDGLALLFALLICGIGTLIMVYAGGYLTGYPMLGRFFLFILAFMASMLGAVLADNLFILYVFWELTSLTSYLLIGFTHEEEEARSAALQSLLVTASGGLALLAGFLLLSQIGGSNEISTLIGNADRIQADPLYVPVLLLILLGAFTKSAQFPFHFWLPGAMSAPTPVSAYLHSATMVKLGIYLLARLSPVLGGTDIWIFAVTSAGAVTMLVGGILALTKTDLKLILAYSTVSALGAMTMFIGLSTEEATIAMIVFLLAHAMYKGALFMVAGAIDHQAGTRDVTHLGGLRAKMPITATIAVLAAVALAGFGPVLSFIGKEMMLETVLHAESAPSVLTTVVVIGGALFVTVAAIVAIRPFFGETGRPPKAPREAPFSMWLGPAVLAVLGLITGVAPALITDTVVAPTATAVLGGVATPIELHLWHGFNTPLILSLVSVITGLAFYAGWPQMRQAMIRLERLFNNGPERWYRLLLDGIVSLAYLQTGLLQSGYLRYYVRTILLATLLLVGTGLVGRVGFVWNLGGPELYFHEVLIAIIMLLAAGVALRSNSLLPAIIALGVVGYGVALIYILFSAPDLAMTQFLVETLTVIVFVLVLNRLPNVNQRSQPRARLLDAVIALATGGLMTALMLTAINSRADSILTPFFAENSYLAAQGRNIVNVILVDFRGGDTMGEIVVLSAASIGIYALLKLRPEEPQEEEL